MMTLVASVQGGGGREVRRLDFHVAVEEDGLWTRATVGYPYDEP